MDFGSLVKDELTVGAEMAQRFDRYAPVKAAFWARLADDEVRDLYIASDAVDETNFDRAYEEVVRLIWELQSPFLNVFRVRVIYGKSPMARAAARLLADDPSPLGVRLQNRTLGDHLVVDGFLYPSPIPAGA